MWGMWLTVALAQDFETHSQAWCFGSGLKVLFEEDHSRPEVRIRTLIEGGSGVEGKSGLAHVVEHLWFENKVAEAKLWDEQHALGLRVNAFTERDVTVFETAGPRASTRSMFAFEIRRLEGALTGVTEASFEVERNIVRNELRQNWTDSGLTVLQPLYQRLFPKGHPYHFLPIGTESTLAGITLADAQAYVDKVYIPANTTLHVTGDLTSEQFESLLSRSFSKALLVDPETQEVTRACGVRTPEGAPPKTEPGEMVHAEGVDNTRSVVAAWTFDPNDQVIVDFDMLLMQWKMKESLKRSVHCSSLAFRHAGVAACQVVLNNDDDPTKMLRRGINVARTMWQPNSRDFLQVNYNSWRSNAMGRLYRSLDGGGSELAAQHFHETGEQDWLEGEIHRLALDDFSLAAKVGDRFQFKNAHIAMIEPATDDPDTRPTFHGRRGDNTVMEVDASVERLTRIIAEPDWSKVTQTRLSSGLTISVLPFGTLKTVRTTLVFPGGAMAETSPVLDQIAWYSLPDTSWEEYKQAQKILGAWDIFRTSDSWVYGLSGVRLDKQLNMLRKHLGDQKSSGDITRRVRKWTASRTPHVLAADLRRERLLPGRAHTNEELLARAKELKPKQLKSWSAAQLGPAGAHLVIVGATDANTASAAKKVFAGYRGTGEPRAKPSQSTIAPPDPIVYVHADGKTTQANVVMECRLDTDDAQVAALAAALFEQRTNGVLRESLGLTYGAYASSSADEAGWRLEFNSRIEKGGVAKTLKTLDAALADLSTKSPSKMLDLAKIDLATQWANRLNTTAEIAHYLGQRVAAGGTASPRTTIAAEIAAITPVQVQKALASCAGHQVVTVVGPIADLEPAGVGFETF